MTTVNRLLAKYIQNTERVIAEIKLYHESVHVDQEKTRSIVDVAKRYLNDAKYYQENQKYETGLVSVAYSEGLLDGLRLLDLAEFEWKVKGGEE